MPRTPHITSETLARAILTKAIGEPDSLAYGLIQGAGSGIFVLALMITPVTAPLPQWIYEAVLQQHAQRSVSQHDTQQHHNNNRQESDPSIQSTSLHEQIQAYCDRIQQGEHRTSQCTADTLLDKALITGCAQWGKTIHQQGLTRWHQIREQWRAQLAQLPLHDADQIQAQLTCNSTYWILGPDSTLWPHQWDDLSQRTDAVAPLCIWGLGDAHVLSACARPIALVGSRYASPEGIRITQQLALHAARRGHTVVSGGAMGIDAAAHAACIQARHERSTGQDEAQAGRTLAIIAGGLNHRGPVRNRPLFDQIMQAHGALISEMAPEEIPRPHRFLLRNRLIAAYASTVIIVQAQARSGALNTATWAADLARPVLAVPGDIQKGHHTGCHELVYQGKATLLPYPQALDDWLHETHAPMLNSTAQQRVQSAILKLLNTAGTTSISMTALLNQLQPTLSEHDILAALGLLEIEHRIERTMQGSIRSVARTTSRTSTTLPAETAVTSAHHTLLHNKPVLPSKPELPNQSALPSQAGLPIQATLPNQQLELQIDTL